MIKPAPKWVLPVIVFAQFAGTSLWFAGNAIVKTIKDDWQLIEGSIASVTSAVQLGFIVGTFLFALLSIADRFRPSIVFFVCASLGALLNLSLIFLPASYPVLLAARFGTGFFIAGIYPVGMKIAADWFEGRLGKALGYLVGALVLGSAFPHLLNYYGGSFSWKYVLVGTSSLALAGGLCMLFFVGEGPHRKSSNSFNPTEVLQVFRKKEFKWAAFGYFGHMWELYTLWAFLPLIITYYNQIHNSHFSPSLWTFVIMALGALGCVWGGVLSSKKGSARVAFYFLLISGLCCFLSPLFFQFKPSIFLFFLSVWGVAVIGDSAQFSSLNAQTAPKASVGTALTIAVGIGFLLTIPSIQLLGFLAEKIEVRWLMLFLVPGPVIGLLNTSKLIRNSKT